MGVKRKASALYEPSPLSQSHVVPSSPPSMTSASTSSSPSSMTTEPYQTNIPRISFQDWPNSRNHMSTSDPMWMDMRTQKRHRDNRPNEEAVHSETVRRLFLAQKEHLDEKVDTTIPMIIGEEDEDMYGDGAGTEDYEGDTMIDDPAPPTSLENQEAGQRSLHDFFGGRKPDRTPFERTLQPPVGQEDDGMEVDGQLVSYSAAGSNAKKATSLAELLSEDVAGAQHMHQWYGGYPGRLESYWHRDQ